MKQLYCCTIDHTDTPLTERYVITSVSKYVLKYRSVIRSKFTPWKNCKIIYAILYTRLRSEQLLDSFNFANLFFLFSYHDTVHTMMIYTSYAVYFTMRSYSI